MRISFIGGGIMAEAMIKGILKARLAQPDQICVGELLDSRRDYLKETYGLRALKDNCDTLSGAELIVLSVKPQSLGEIVSDIAPMLESEQVVISIMAGVSLDALQNALSHQAVIRVMPNTPAQIGKGITVWTASESVSEDIIRTSRKILATLGEELFVKEEKFINMATAVSASGPAYVFLFIESLIDAGVYLGMSREMARKLVLGTIKGSTDLVLTTQLHPADLKDMVTSPGGTTAEALMVFEEAGFKGIVLQAVAAAYEKSETLGRR